jgi:5-dehydro-2-deoxygluconokinase
LLTIGRIGVDIYGQELGRGLQDPQTFAKAVGGSATNVAVAAARLGHRAAVLTKVGDDSLGTYAVRDCEALGVDTRWISRMTGGRTALALTGLDDPAEPELVFYRDANTPDLQITSDDLADEVARGVGVLWYTGSALSREPSTSTVLHALEVRANRDHVVFDLDYRPTFWNSPVDATTAIGAAIDFATITIGNRQECSVALDMPIHADPDDYATALLERGVKVAIVKQGADGVLVATTDTRVVVPGIPVDVVCGLGAGDAFGGAFVHGILSGWTPVDAVTYANAAGAIVASRLLCSHAMPTDAEVRELLASAGRKVPE